MAKKTKKHPYGSPKRYNKLRNKQLREAVELAHTGLAMALRGDFDAVWGDSTIVIDGVKRLQREVFFENVMSYLPKMDKEFLKRELQKR